MRVHTHPHTLNTTHTRTREHNTRHKRACISVSFLTLLRSFSAYCSRATDVPRTKTP